MVSEFVFGPNDLKGNHQMKVYLTFDEFENDTVTLRARAEHEDGTIGDMIKDIRPTETFGPYTYEQLREHGPGILEIEEKS